jgi:hypothetical protein
MSYIRRLIVSDAFASIIAYGEALIMSYGFALVIVYIDIRVV